MSQRNFSERNTPPSRDPETLHFPENLETKLNFPFPSSRIHVYFPYAHGGLRDNMSSTERVLALGFKTDFVAFPMTL